MCFAINLYNTLCIHTLVVHGPERYNDNMGRLEFFRKVRGSLTLFQGVWQSNNVVTANSKGGGC
jgi:hypothetical protein